MSAESPDHPVVVYIEDQRGTYLTGEILRSAGFDVRSAETIAELEQALECLAWGVVVTVTAKIAEVRSLSNIPIVNIQAFVLPDQDASRPSSLFDKQAFLARVRNNSKPVPGTSRGGARFAN